ncbi:hypothetical protein [Methanosarcina sp.]|uniref:hypothetical protein n=1 Tax=Methanosarcina sp. TaxID=2213 RepID=UPI003C7279D8
MLIPPEKRRFDGRISPYSRSGLKNNGFLPERHKFRKKMSQNCSQKSLLKGSIKSLPQKAIPEIDVYLGKGQIKTLSILISI